MLEFETLEEFSVASEDNATTVTVRLRRLLNHTPSRFCPEPYFLDLTIGSICHPYYGIEQQNAREIAARFLLKHLNAITPPLH